MNRSLSEYVALILIILALAYGCSQLLQRGLTTTITETFVKVERER